MSVSTYCVFLRLSLLSLVFEHSVCIVYVCTEEIITAATGFEPGISGLKVKHITNELWRHDGD